ncbi:hypothetical protein [Planctomicrobium piriforme]|uniref:hypothetical protein n=1 Tax=Planctomicrobium piriforme TaxID=1576369 RepID=UPI001587BB30|nr:hypothetical protein [Planctomicrobium piriforme]
MFFGLTGSPSAHAQGIWPWNWYRGYAYGAPVYAPGGFASYPAAVTTTSFYGPSVYPAFSSPVGCNTCGTPSPCSSCNPCGTQACGSCSPCGTGDCASGNCPNGNCANGNCGAGYAPPITNGPTPDPTPNPPAANPPVNRREPPLDEFTPVRPRENDARPNMPNSTIPSGNAPPTYAPAMPNSNSIPDARSSSPSIPEILPETTTSPPVPNRTFQDPNDEFRAPTEGRRPAPMEPTNSPEVLPLGTGLDAPKPLEIEPSDLTASVTVPRQRVLAETRYRIPSVARMTVSPRPMDDTSPAVLARN